MTQMTRFNLILIACFAAQLGCDNRKSISLRSDRNDPASTEFDESASTDSEQSVRIKSELTPVEIKHKAQMHSQHGFGFNLTAQEISSAFDPSKVPPSVASPEEAENAKRLPTPSAVYSGRSLALDKCLSAGFGGNSTQAELARAAMPPNARHLSEILTQSYLMELYGPGQRWFESGLMSLEEWDPDAVIRPRDPVHPFLRKRLGRAVDPGPDYWKLAAVSFRVGDRAALSEIASSRPILGQIKIAYLLDGRAAEAHSSIISAAFIHSIVIHPDYYDEFIYDLLTIRQDISVAGCDVFRIVDKYVRNNGANQGQKPRSYYFFAHTNIFDDFDPIPVHEWRFTELKPVAHDLPETIRPVDDLTQVALPTSRDSFDAGAAMAETFMDGSSPSPSPSSMRNLYGRISVPEARRQAVRDSYLVRCRRGEWIQNAARQPHLRAQLSSVEIEALSSCPAKADQELINQCWAAAAASRCEENAVKMKFPTNRVAEAFENVPAPRPGTGDQLKFPQPDRRLRIVPMKFVPSEVVDDTSNRIKPRPDLAYSVFFSGTVTDCAQLDPTDPIQRGETLLNNPDAPSDINCRLLIKPDGQRVRPDHPAFAREEAYSCAGCHMRREGLNLNPSTHKLDTLASMNKAHISHGDGGNGVCNSFLMHPRSENQISLSSYFLDFANGHAMNGYSPVAVNPMPPVTGVFDAGTNLQSSFEFGASIDFFRCFSRDIDPGEQLP
jgi:hypothetical protein